MKTRFAAAVVSLTFLAVTAFAAPRAADHARRSAPVRVASMTEEGAKVTLRFEDGKSVELSKNDVHIMRRGQSASATSVESLTAASGSGSLPAIATLIYRPDGTVRKARVQVFSSSAEASAFLQRSSRRAALNHQPKQ